MGKLRYIGKNQGGNTLIIVLAILTVLTILVSTTYYISTLENISAANFSSNVKARFAALGGLPEARKMFFENKDYTALTQEWARNPYNVRELPRGGLPSWNTNSYDDEGEKIRNLSNASLRELRRLQPYRAPLLITDESSLININAVGMLNKGEDESVIYGVSPFEIDLGAYLEEVIKNELPQIDPSIGGILAESIIRYRYGPDGKPGRANYDDDGDNTLCENDGIDNDYDGEIDEPNEGIDEPDEFISDPRIAPNGDDRPFRYLNDLFNIRNVDKQLIQAIAPYVTVYSSTDNLVYINDEPVVPVDINKASVDEILKQLKIIYKNAEEEMLIQYVLNCVDARDRDSIPTVYENDGETMLGIEVTPYINEVYADSKSLDEDGDDGQYVEIYNPWSKDIDVTGWRLTALNSVYLNGKIKAGGYLIVTDDYDEQQDPSPEDDEKSYGCFFDIFGIIPDENLKRMIEFPFFDIDNKSGTVTLEDAKGNLIDIFKYSGGENSFGYKSFQRNDPRLKFCELLECTPYSNSINFKPSESYKQMLADREEMDKPFLTPVELMKVYAGYVSSEEGSGIKVISEYPQIRESNSQISSNIIDLFKTVESQRNRELSSDELKRINYSEQTEKSALQADILIGLININTASKDVLKALPGIKDELPDNIIKYAALIENDLSIPIQNRVPFKKVSDLLRADDIWGGITNSKRIDLFSKIYNLLTVRSNVFSVESEGFDYAETGNKPISKTFVLAMIGEENGKQFIYDIRLSDYFVKPIKESR